MRTTMILNDKKLKALVKKIQKEAGTAPSSNKKTTYVDETIAHKQDEEGSEVFQEMKKLPYA